MKLNENDITNAYLALKNHVYYDNINLFLKQRLSEFESVDGSEFEQRLQTILSVFGDADFESNEQLIGWLDQIDFHLLPKSIEPRKEGNCEEESDKGLFISNVRESEGYDVSKVNYFINAPIELHILDALWCLVVAPALEHSMSKDSYGNRLSSQSLAYSNKRTLSGNTSVFRRYITQYNQWRDQAITQATRIFEGGDDVALLSIDLQSFYYHVNIDFENVKSKIKEHYADKEYWKTIAIQLTDILDYIFSVYADKIAPSFEITHPDCFGKKGLPIGLMSSAVLANWYLTPFDKKIAEEVRPEYFGRYVDDMIFVFKRPKIAKQDSIKNFIHKYLKPIELNASGKTYDIQVDDNLLPIQQQKVILQFYDKKHGKAGLDLFRQELDERSSAFRFLPEEHMDKDLDRFAYDIIYKGSANKFRSIVGLREDETELAKYLASQITAHRLCRVNRNQNVVPQLKRFLKGINALQFSRLWEKIYQYAIITQKYKFATQIYTYIRKQFESINCIDEQNNIHEHLSNKIKDDFEIYNDLSLGLTVGLLDLAKLPKDILDFDFNLFGEDCIVSDSKNLTKIAPYHSKVHQYAVHFRNANLIRHHLVAWPLMNYSGFGGDLTLEIESLENNSNTIDELKLKFSPRFIHFDEWQLFHLNTSFVSDGNFLNCLRETKSEYEKKYQALPFLVTDNHVENGNPCKNTIYFENDKNKDKLKLAIANINVKDSDIEGAINRSKSPNLSYERQMQIYDVLNSAVREKADLLILPELSVAVSWLPFIVSYARRSQLGIVLGLEHWIADGVAYNLLVEIMPYKVDDKYKSCVVIPRLKNYYAPAEVELLESLRIKKPKSDRVHQYHSINWRGVSFASYNCFELADIKHRALFKSEIDLLIACVWNKDTNYYQHVLESAVRDLHCYAVQVNTSQFGSYVLQPSRTETRVKLAVQGGDNISILTTTIDINKLRSFQFKSKPNGNTEYKPLPPGYDCEAVINRAKRKRML